MHRYIREKRLATVLVRLHQAQTRSMDSVQVCSGNRISCLIISLIRTNQGLCKFLDDVCKESRTENQNDQGVPVLTSLEPS